jgi:hypothetical protein
MREQNYSASGAFGASDIQDLQFERDVVAVHRLGPRPLSELLREIGARTQQRALVDSLTARYARLDPDLRHAVGADQFPPRSSLRLVRGRRD